jgi:hypothetical protein
MANDDQFGPGDRLLSVDVPNGHGYEQVESHRTEVCASMTGAPGYPRRDKVANLRAL